MFSTTFYPIIALLLSAMLFLLRLGAMSGNS